MKIQQTIVEITTSGRGLINLTHQMEEVVQKTGFYIGLCHIFLHHTSASLILCENADPLVQKDLETYFQRLIPDAADIKFQHTAEGSDDMPAHIRTIMTGSELSIPITNGKLALGRWQGVFLWEHRFHHFLRKITITIQGESAPIP